MVIRPVIEDDIPSLYKICLQTADAGEDATPLVRHRKLLGDYYVAPYFAFEQSICFSIEQTTTIAGYIVGVAETNAYQRWLNSHWLPELRQQYPTTLVTKSGLEQAVLEQLYRPMEVNDYLKDFPSHLHINLESNFRGKGFGKQLMQTFINAAAEKGSTGIHLEVSIHNRRAILFYQHQGFTILDSIDDALIMGKRL